MIISWQMDGQKLILIGSFGVHFYRRAKNIQYRGVTVKMPSNDP